MGVLGGGATRCLGTGALYGVDFNPTSNWQTLSCRVPTSCTRISMRKPCSTQRAWYVSPPRPMARRIGQVLPKSKPASGSA